MATYKEIREHTRKTRGFVPQNCWIAHVLDTHGLTQRIAPNRQDPQKRVKPCPENKWGSLEAAMRELGALPSK